MVRLWDQPAGFMKSILEIMIIRGVDIIAV
jgi:hypothetical protein